MCNQAALIVLAFASLGLSLIIQHERLIRYSLLRVYRVELLRLELWVMDLFSANHYTAKASLILGFSMMRLGGLIETAKANGLESRAYITHLFENLPKAKSENH